LKVCEGLFDGSASFPCFLLAFARFLLAFACFLLAQGLRNWPRNLKSTGNLAHPRGAHPSLQRPELTCQQVRGSTRSAPGPVPAHDLPPAASSCCRAERVCRAGTRDSAGGRPLAAKRRPGPVRSALGVRTQSLLDTAPFCPGPETGEEQGKTKSAFCPEGTRREPREQRQPDFGRSHALPRRRAPARSLSLGSPGADVRNLWTLISVPGYELLARAPRHPRYGLL